MNQETSLFEHLATRLEALVKSNAVVGDVIAVGDRYAMPVVELTLSLGGAEGQGEGDDPETGIHGGGTGGGAGGGARATPVAVLVVEGDTLRLDSLGH